MQDNELFSKQTSKLSVCNGELNGMDSMKRYLILFKVSLNLVDAFTKVLVLPWSLHCIRILCY